MTGLKVYVDLMSQPSRALLLFLRANNIPHEQKIVSIAKGEHKQPDYLKIQKMGQVPAIEDNGTPVMESVAILRYLSRKYNVPDNWYPKDFLTQTKVDEFLEWQHIGLRSPLASYTYTKFIGPRITGQPASQAVLDVFHSKMEHALNQMDKVWLKDSPYVVGDKISIADLLALCEVEQTQLAGYDATAGRPQITAWVERLRKELSPHHGEVNQIINKVLEKTKSSNL